MVGVDISDAIESTRVNTQGMSNVHLVQADVYHLPFRPGAFDFAYSIGVLHHLPEPEKAYQCVVQLVKPRGSVFIWVYSNSRRFVNFVLETARAVTTRSPKKVQQGISLAAASIDYAGFILPYRVAARLPVIGPIARRFGLPRLKLYGEYPFQVAYADLVRSPGGADSFLLRRRSDARLARPRAPRSHRDLADGPVRLARVR